MARRLDLDLGMFVQCCREIKRIKLTWLVSMRLPPVQNERKFPVVEEGLMEEQKAEVQPCLVNTR